MTLDDYMKLTNDEKDEVRKKFLDFMHAYDFKGAYEYYNTLSPIAQKHIRTESNCSWQYLEMNSRLDKIDEDLWL